MSLYKRHLLFAGIAFATIVLDQLTKWLILSQMSVHETLTIVPGFLNIVHVQNPGGAFGMFASQSSLFRILVFVVISLVAVGLIIYLYFKTPADAPFLAGGLSLVLGGAVGNLIDRLRFGKVIDFIDVYVGAYHWPAFNVADSAITTGMVIFGYYVIFKKIPA